MLKPLRRKNVIKITMWVLLATFVIWGAQSAVVTNRNYAGIIFGKKVSTQEYVHNYNAILNHAKMIYGDQLSKIQNFLNLRSQAWDRLILLYYAKKRMIRASNKEVVERIASMPSFQSSGSFDQRAYDYIVQNIFAVSPRDFEESVREDIIISKLIDSIQKDISLTEEEIENAYKIKNEKADVSYVLITPGSFRKDVSADEAELLPFYDSNKERFKTPERINVLYLKIPFDEKAPAEKEKAKNQAQGINDYLNIGDDFQALAKQHNLSIQETGPFYFTEPISQIGLSYPFTMTAFGLTKEKPNALVEEKDAFYVIRLKEKIAPFIPSFEEVKEIVKEALINKKAGELAKASAQNYAQLLKTGKDTLENLSKQVNVNINEIKDITRGSSAQGEGLSEEFDNACFSIKEKEFAGPVASEKGFAILRLDKLKPVDKELFEKEKLSFKSALLEEKKKNVFIDWFAKIKEKAALKIGTAAN